jgi:hypothetical protein
MFPLLGRRCGEIPMQINSLNLFRERGPLSGVWREPEPGQWLLASLVVFY